MMPSENLEQAFKRLYMWDRARCLDPVLDVLDREVSDPEEIAKLSQSHPYEFTALKMLDRCESEEAETELYRSFGVDLKKNPHEPLGYGEESGEEGETVKVVVGASDEPTRFTTTTHDGLTSIRWTVGVGGGGLILPPGVKITDRVPFKDSEKKPHSKPTLQDLRDAKELWNKASETSNNESIGLKFYKMLESEMSEKIQKLWTEPYVNELKPIQKEEDEEEDED